MSAQPMPRPVPEQEIERRKKHSNKADVLYVVGALLVTAGVSLIKVHYGLIVAGGFCMLMPLLELAVGFVRGIKGR
jgi:hypothetical protein